VWWHVKLNYGKIDDNNNNNNNSSMTTTTNKQARVDERQGVHWHLTSACNLHRLDLTSTG